MTKRYLEDLQVGEKILTPAVTVTEEDVIEFARRFDPQPMHMDRDAPGGLIASGWHTAALVMRMTVDANPLGGLPILGLGVDGIQWPQQIHRERNGEKIYEIFSESVTVNQQLTDNLFAVPGPDTRPDPPRKK